jgi:hypothetical protein
MRSVLRRPRARGTGPAMALRLIGAAGLLVMAGVHLQRLLGAGYDQIPTIDTLFWLDVAAGFVLGVAVVVRGQALVALAGAAVAAGAIVALLVSHSSGLFGFTEPRFDAAVVIALVSEATAVVSLLGLLGMRLGDRVDLAASRSS